MSYIDVEKALESINLIAEKDGKSFDKDSARYAIQTTEPADVVEVVRCKDCKHRDKSGLCQAEGQKLTIAKDNHFCSKGERRLDNG